MARIKKSGTELQVFPGLKEPMQKDLIRVRTGRKAMGQFCCRFVPDVYEGILQLSKQKNQSRAEIVRTAVVKWLMEEGVL